LQLAHDLGDKVVAVKEASGDFLQIMEIQKDKPEDFLVISGDDLIALPMISLGCSGVVSVIGNALPAMMSQMINEALAGSNDSAKELHFKLLPLIKAIFKEGNPTGLKALMEIRGTGDNNLRLPLISASADLYAEIRHLNSQL